MASKRKAVAPLAERPTKFPKVTLRLAMPADAERIPENGAIPEGGGAAAPPPKPKPKNGLVRCSRRGNNVHSLLVQNQDHPLLSQPQPDLSQTQPNSARPQPDSARLSQTSARPQPNSARPQPDLSPTSARLSPTQPDSPRLTPTQCKSEQKFVRVHDLLGAAYVNEFVSYCGIVQ